MSCYTTGKSIGANHFWRGKRNDHVRKKVLIFKIVNNLLNQESLENPDHFIKPENHININQPEEPES